MSQYYHDQRENMIPYMENYTATKPNIIAGNRTDFQNKQHTL